MIQSSLANTALIFLMHLCIMTMMNNKRHLPDRFIPMGMVLLTSITVITMFYFPIQLGSYFVDLRLVPLVMLAIRWGWKLAVPTLMITSLWRLLLGGEGTLPGILFGMILPVLFVLYYRMKKKEKPRFVSIIYLFIMSWLICDVPIIFLIPNGWSLFQDIALIRFVSYVTVAMIYYFFILDADKSYRLTEKLQYYAEHDPLTGLYNMRYFEEKIKSFFSEERKMYIVMVDLDYFKQINDVYGHLNGDEILRRVSRLMREKVSDYTKTDYVFGRYGGEEFILFLAVERTEELFEVVNTIHTEVKNTSFSTLDQKQTIKVTVSIGVAQLFDLQQLDTTIEQADQSLYQSKNKGRNQIHYAENVS